MSKVGLGDFSLPRSLGVEQYMVVISGDTSRFFFFFFYEISRPKVLKVVVISRRSISMSISEPKFLSRLQSSSPMCPIDSYKYFLTNITTW